MSMSTYSITWGGEGWRGMRQVCERKVGGLQGVQRAQEGTRWHLRSVATGSCLAPPAGLQLNRHRVRIAHAGVV